MTLQDTFESEATENESSSAQQVTKMPPPAAASAGVGDNAAEDEVVPGMLVSRPCHDLEALFVDLNIRFAVGMLFAASSVVSVKAAREALAAGLNASGLDRLRVDDATSQDGTKSIVLSRESSISLETVSMTDESLPTAIEALVAKNDVPSTGTVQCYVLLDDNNSSTATSGALASNESDAALGIVINANHALCDGRLLRECMNVIVDTIIGGGGTTACPPSSLQGPTVLRNLTDELTAWSHQNPPPVPTYLPPSHECVNVARLSEIPNFVDSTVGDETKGGSTLRRDIPGTVTLACMQQLRSKQASVTGFMAACWIQAINEAIVKSNACNRADGDERKSIVTISCLVALHDQLPEGLYTNAFGTVTLAGESVRSEATDGGASSRDEVLANRLLDLAANCTTDLRRRIRRTQGRGCEPRPGALSRRIRVVRGHPGDH